MIAPEPEGDIRAQLLAVCDPNHPKQACFIPAQTLEALVEERPEGMLFTFDKALAEAFRRAPAEPEAAFDRAMAEILGYPEAKPDAILSLALARIVQARSADDWVVHEAMTSPAMLGRTAAELQKHVPPGGRLLVLTPAEVLARRQSLREAGK